MQKSSGLLVVFWEATNVYCAFNVLEVDLLQHSGRQGVCKSSSWMHVSDSGSHLGVGEARVRLEAHPDSSADSCSPKAPKRFWGGSGVDRRSKRQQLKRDRRCSPAMKSYLQKENGRN